MVISRLVAWRGLRKAPVQLRVRIADGVVEPAKLRLVLVLIMIIPMRGADRDRETERVAQVGDAVRRHGLCGAPGYGDALHRGMVLDIYEVKRSPKLLGHDPRRPAVRRVESERKRTVIGDLALLLYRGRGILDDIFY